MTDEIINWLLEGDPSVRYQVHRDLLNTSAADLKDLRSEINRSGWGRDLLDRQLENGHWGCDFYYPKWISSHYTLLDLRNLQAEPTTGIARAIDLILRNWTGRDGGINPSKTIDESDVCVTGMFLDYACWFETEGNRLVSAVDYILKQQMGDGGYNCEKNRPGASHSSLHSTICCLEGFRTFRVMGYSYRLDEITRQVAEAEEFILKHRLYLSDHSGDVIHKDMTRLAWPGRWKYDILRALDYFAASDRPADERMNPALEILMRKRRNDGTWPMQAGYAGRIHFSMEQAGKPGRINTLRALRVLKAYGSDR